MRKDGTEFVSEAQEGQSSIAYRDQMNSQGSPSEAVSATYHWTAGTELMREAQRKAA
jgi:hypothetical protein